MLGKALRFIRVFHDLRQADVAARLGVSKSYLSEIEGGTKSPSLPLVEKYSREFDIPVSSIMFFSERLDSGTDVPVKDKAQQFVASKILAMMSFIETKADRHPDE